MRWFASLCFCAFLALPVQAGGICRQRVVSHAAVVEPFVAVQKIVAVDAQAVTVPVSSYALPVYDPTSYYRVNADYRDRVVIAAIVQETLRQLQATPDLSAQQLRAVEPQPTMPVTSGNTGGGCNCGCNCNKEIKPAEVDCSKCKCVPADAPTSQPAGGGDTGATGDPSPVAPDANLDAAVLRIFMDTAGGKKSCVECHGGGDNLHGGLKLVSVQNGAFVLENLPADKRLKIHVYSDKGLMPPSVLKDPVNPNMEHAVTDADLQVLWNWYLQVK